MESTKRLFALEGGEATGKSTISTELQRRLTEDGYEVIRLRDPGNTRISEEIRKVIMMSEMDKMTELLLYLASRRELIAQEIVPALERGAIVILDRFYLSSLAYQGYARGIGIDKVRELNSSVCGDILPDTNYLIEIPYQESLKRKMKVDEINRLDLAGDLFHQNVEEGFKIIKENNQDSIVAIDGMENIENITDFIYNSICEKLSA